MRKANPDLTTKPLSAGFLIGLMAFLKRQFWERLSAGTAGIVKTAMSPYPNQRLNMKGKTPAQVFRDGLLRDFKGGIKKAA